MLILSVIYRVWRVMKVFAQKKKKKKINITFLVVLLTQRIDGKESNMAKGVNIATEFNEFKETLFNKKVVRHKMKRIQSKKHKIGTCQINKISLSCFDDKSVLILFRMVGGGGGWETKRPPASFSSPASAKVGFRPENFFAISFDPFVTLV